MSPTPSFLLPEQVFGPDCYLYDWKCGYNTGLPCSGHGNCLSTFPNECMCFQGYATCAPVGGSNGCETNLYRDAANCGACGNVCTADAPICCGMAGCVANATVCQNANTTRATAYLPDQVRSPGTGGAPSGAVDGVVSAPLSAPVDGAARARAGGRDPTRAARGASGSYAGAVSAGRPVTTSTRGRRGPEADAQALMAGAGDDTSAEDAVAATADPGLGAVGGGAVDTAEGAAAGDALPLGNVEAGMPPQSYAVAGGMTAAEAAAARAGAAAKFEAAAGGGSGAVAPAGGAHSGHGAPASASASAPHSHSQFAPMPGGEAMSAPKASDAVDVPPPGPVQALLAGRP